MPDVEITFEREGLSGVVAVGTYLSDAMKRFGIRLSPECDIVSGHYCAVTVEKGEELLSPPTVAETEHFSNTPRRSGQRLACHAKIVKPGEIVVMTKEKQEESKSETSSEQYRKAFSELPLEEKISELVRLEAIALGETFSFILNSPFKIAEKVGDVMAEFGMKMENAAKQAARPEEHTADGEPKNGAKHKSRKAASKKKTE
jgi:ferredoxin